MSTLRRTILFTLCVGLVLALVRSERFYYDGVRRIQEMFVDPVLSIGGALGSGDGGLVGAGEEEHAETGALRGFRRKHDLQTSAGHFMEVKSGTQGPTLRVMKQIERDRLLINQQRTTGVKSVRWLFYTKDGTTKGVHPSILKELDNNGIMWSVQKSPYLK